MKDPKCQAWGLSREGIGSGARAKKEGGAPYAP